MWMANTVTTLDKICVEFRSLQRSEIAEIEESFGKSQVGSSTMPHKRNPIKSEQVCGLARIVRAMVEPELLNNTLWDERDLTNSSSERVIFPETCVLMDHILKLAEGIIVDYDSKVGDEYKTSDGVRTVTSKSTEDDYFWGGMLIKVMEVEETPNKFGVKKIVYQTNHKFGLVAVEFTFDDDSFAILPIYTSAQN